MDLVRFSARRSGPDYVVKWTLAAPPRGTLVAATAEDGSIVAMKVYEDPSQEWDAYTFNGENHYLDTYSREIQGRTITVRAPQSDLGSTRTLKASTEKVGEGPADDGPTVTIP